MCVCTFQCVCVCVCVCVYISVCVADITEIPQWHNIRHKKGAEDAKRSIVFAKVAMQVRAAMDHGGNSPSNSQLSNVLKKAKELKVPKDIIDRAIKKAEEAKAGGLMMYEGMGPAGVSVMVQCVTDKPSRTAPVLRHIFKEHGGSLGTTNSVAFKFNKMGQIDVAGVTAAQADALVDTAITLGADDVEELAAGTDAEAGTGPGGASTSTWRIMCAPDALGLVSKGIAEAGFPFETALLVMVPVRASCVRAVLRVCACVGTCAICGHLFANALVLVCFTRGSEIGHRESSCARSFDRQWLLVVSCRPQQSISPRRSRRP